MNSNIIFNLNYGYMVNFILCSLIAKGKVTFIIFLSRLYRWKMFFSFLDCKYWF